MYSPTLWQDHVTEVETVIVSPAWSFNDCCWWIALTAISAASSPAFEMPSSMWLKFAAFCGVPCWIISPSTTASRWLSPGAQKASR